VGGRGPLIAFNVNLETEDVRIAKRIAAKIRRVRDSGKGLPGVKAIGVRLSRSGCVQVSTNITMPDQVTMQDVLSFVEREARGLNVAVKETELVGTIRIEHLAAAASQALGLKKPVCADAVLKDC